jgi:uncharacterized membrane protein SpoIIM required for sporulation
MINEKNFVAERKKDWEHLAKLLDKASVSLRRLSKEELVELTRLHRKVARDLAILRTYSANQELILFLSNLVLRAHGFLYRHPKKPLLQSLYNLAQDSAIAVRKHKFFVFLAIAIQVASGFLASHAIALDPANLQVILPPEFEEILDKWKERTHLQGDPSSSLAMTGFYLLNNTLVTVRVLAGGLTFGIFSLYVLFVNGMLLGAFIKELAPAGALGHFLTSIAPHGVSELLGITIGGAGGLLIGWTMLNPGEFTRAYALKKIGKEAVLMLALGIAMIWVAAPIEAWVSFQRYFPNEIRLLIALGTALFWLAFLLYAGRTKETLSQAPPNPFHPYKRGTHGPASPPRKPPTP